MDNTRADFYLCILDIAKTYIQKRKLFIFSNKRLPELEMLIDAAGITSAGYISADTKRISATTNTYHPSYLGGKVAEFYVIVPELAWSEADWALLQRMGYESLRDFLWVHHPPVSIACCNDVQNTQGGGTKILLFDMTHQTCRFALQELALA